MAIHKVNPNIEVVGEYNTKKVKFLCKIHNESFETDAYNALKGHFSCKKCKSENHSKAMIMSHEQYVCRLKEVNQKIKVCEKYRGSNISIKHHCLVHNSYWDAYPSNILKGCGCKECGKEKTAFKFRKSKDEYIEELFKKNPAIKLIGDYTGCEDKTLFKCICGHKWESIPQVFVGSNRGGCPRCATEYNKIRKTKGMEQYKNEVTLKNPEVEVIGNTYINNMTPLKHKCKKCGHVWDSIPNNILKGHGCKKCANVLVSERFGKTHEQFLDDFIRVNPSSDTIKILSSYTGSHEKIKCRCSSCGTYWKVQATDLLTGTGCPICKSSFGERLIAKVLKSSHIKYTPQKSFNNLVGLKNGLLSYDFYLNDYNLLIEMQGEQHERPIEFFGGEEQFSVQQEHDRRKREYAKLHNINLLEIWYYDIDNIEEIITKYIKNLKLESRETVIPSIAI